jgi:carbohydrate kinase (thermoresistant glucokinase family)
MMQAPFRVVVMGVSGCGKSTVGHLLAGRLETPFVEGDDSHSAANVAKMAAGQPLTDEDRAGWLQALSLRLRQSVAQAQGLVVACSALKKVYRDVLRQGAPDVLFVHLQGSPEVLTQRLQQRTGHYMPATLLQSQLAILEPLTKSESALTLDMRMPAEQQCQQVMQHLQTLCPASLGAA